MPIACQRYCAMLILTLAWTNVKPLEAGALELVFVDNSSGGSALADFVSWDIYLTGSGTDWTSAETRLKLSRGSLYQDPVGGMIAPDPADFEAHPSVEFDTYVGIVGDTTTTISGPATMLGGGPQMRFDTTMLDVRWSNTADESGLSQIPILRVSFSNDATGTWDILATREGQAPQILDLAMFNGMFYLKGDLNQDGFVGQDDLGSVLANWGNNVPPGHWNDGDPSGDGFVSQDDLNHVLGHWGEGIPPPAIAAFNSVPEPRSLLLTIAAIVLLLPCWRNLRWKPTWCSI